jgi:hypothetical protein
MESKDPNLVNTQAAATGEINAEMLDAVFMKAVAVPPKLPPTSRQAAQATGASSGDSVKIDVVKGPNAPRPLVITVPPATVLENSNAAGQGMVIAGVRGRAISESMFEPTSRIVLNGPEVATYILSAFLHGLRGGQSLYNRFFHNPSTES